MSQSPHTQGIQVGDTVAFRWQVAQSRGWCAPDLLRARGKVTAVELLQCSLLFHIAWDRPGLPRMLGASEICQVSPGRLGPKPAAATPPPKSDG